MSEENNTGYYHASDTYYTATLGPWHRIATPHLVVLVADALLLSVFTTDRVLVHDIVFVPVLVGLTLLLNVDVPAVVTHTHNASHNR